MAKYKVNVPIISGYTTFCVEAESEAQAIEKIEEGEFDESLIEHDFDYGFGDAVAYED